MTTMAAPSAVVWTAAVVWISLVTSSQETCWISPAGISSVQVTCSGVDHLPTDIPIDTTHLILAGNNITSLSGFPLLPYLEILDVSNNSISAISPGDLPHLPVLRELDLSYNNLSMNSDSLPAGCFTGVANITTLKLLSNPPTGIPIQALKDLSWLQELQVSLPDSNQLPRELGDLTHLERIHFYQSNITRLSPSMFDHLRHSNLRQLSFQSKLTILEEIENGTFANFRHLKSLSFACSYYEDLLSTITNGLQYLGSTPLEDLIADNAALPDGYYASELYERQFCNDLGDKLVRLSLRALRILKIENPMLQCFKRLEVFSVGLGNSPYFWSEVPRWSTYVNLSMVVPNVRILDLSHFFVNGPVNCESGVRSIESYFDAPFCEGLVPDDHPVVSRPSSSALRVLNAYVLPPKIECILLDNAAAFEFPNPQFSSSTRIHITLPLYKFNNLKALDMSKTKITFGNIVTVVGLKRLQKLSLAESEIPFLHYNIYHCLGFPELRFLNLSNTGLHGGDHAFRSAFNCLSRLQTLDLSGNEIKTIDPNAFSTLRSLRSLFLNGNQLDLNFSLDLSDLRDLTHIGLDRNQMVKLDASLIDQLEILANSTTFTVGLLDNPFRCECDTLDFVDWFLSTSVHILHRNRVTCRYGDRHVPMNNETHRSLLNECKTKMSKNLLTVIVVCSAMVVLTVVVVTAAVRWRWHILWYYYTLRIRHRSSGLSREQHLHQHDLFIATCQDSLDDSIFITKLLDALKQYSPDLATFILGVDDMPGDLRADVIVNAADQAKKTLLVVTHDFIEDSWCDFALQMALVKGLQHVVILHKDISEEEVGGMTKTLRRLMISGNVPQLQWPVIQIEEDVVVLELINLLHD